MRQKQNAAGAGTPSGKRSAIGDRSLHKDFTRNRERRQRGQPVFTDGGKFAGTVYSDGTLFKAVNGTRHLLRTPPAIAYDVSVLRHAETLGATQLVVVDKETGTRYGAPMSLMQEKGIALNRGHGLQRALVLSLWEVCRTGDDPRPKQLGLFTEASP